MTIFRLILLLMRNVSNKTCREYQNTHFIFSNIFPNFVPFMRMSKNVVEPERLQMTMWRMRIACWIRLHARAHTHTHTQKDVIRNAFPQQQWFRKCAPMLRYMHIACRYIYPITGTNPLFETQCYITCWGKQGDRIRNSQIQEVLNQEPVTKMVYRWELRWFGHLIRMHNSGKRKQVWNRGDEKTRGRVKREHLMGKRSGTGWWNPTPENATSY